MTYRILVVDDDPNIAKILGFNLERESFEVLIAHDGQTGWELFREHVPDLVLLDVMMPGRSGLDVCHLIRNSDLPQPGIILLSVRAEEMDAILGLTTGADDYVRKPFGVTEVVARCRSLLQRRERDASGPVALPVSLTELSAAPEEREGGLAFGDVSIDPRRRELWIGEAIVDLTPTEFDLVYFLARSPGHVFTRPELLDKVRGYDSDVYARTVDCHIARLRKKVVDAGGPKELIQTVFRVGYRFQDRLLVVDPAVAS